MNKMQLLTEQILFGAHHHTWYIHGLGFMFMRMSEYSRLHVFHGSLKVEGTGEVHDHFWSFYSTIICGQLTNFQYKERADGDTYSLYTLDECGMADKVIEANIQLNLHESSMWYPAGEQYFQPHNGLHRTAANNGTVTLLERHSEPNKPNVRVLVPLGKPYITWNEREATLEEIEIASQAALKELKIS